MMDTRTETQIFIDTYGPGMGDFRSLGTMWLEAVHYIYDICIKTSLQIKFVYFSTNNTSHIFNKHYTIYFFPPQNVIYLITLHFSVPSNIHILHKASTNI